MLRHPRIVGFVILLLLCATGLTSRLTTPCGTAFATPSTWTNSMGMEFVLIPAGTFQMGSDERDAYVSLGYRFLPSERPIHTVHITQPFYLGKYKVTQGQWQEVMGNNPSLFTRHFMGLPNLLDYFVPYLWSKPSRFRNDPSRPVEGVSWNDVQEFIRRLNSREDGVTYRLPTEAEWEYAARAGTTSRWSFGGDDEKLFAAAETQRVLGTKSLWMLDDDKSQLGRYAWYGDNSWEQTHPVGQLQPNPWGLYDMYGNVHEWVQDWYAKYECSTTIDPTGPFSGSSHVIRGCGWNSSIAHCRSATRRDVAPDARGVGVRLLRVVPNPALAKDPLKYTEYKESVFTFELPTDWVLFTEHERTQFKKQFETQSQELFRH